MTIKNTKSYFYITSNEFHEVGVLKNPIMFNDFYLENCYPQFFKVYYGVKITATKKPTKEEKSMPFYNDYRDRYGNSDITVIDETIKNSDSTNVLLNGFSQEQFDYIAPLIKDSVKVLYLFKCPRIHDLSALSGFSKLECALIYWNNSLETLWNMEHNEKLKVISFDSITKLKYIETLKDSKVEYINFDSLFDSGKKHKMLFDKSVFKEIPTLKYLNLRYIGIDEHITL